MRNLNYILLNYLIITFFYTKVIFAESNSNITLVNEEESICLNNNVWTICNKNKQTKKRKTIGTCGNDYPRAIDVSKRTEDFILNLSLEQYNLAEPEKIFDILWKAKLKDKDTQVVIVEQIKVLELIENNRIKFKVSKTEKNKILLAKTRGEVSLKLVYLKTLLK